MSNDGAYWHYWGRCRKCGQVEDWVVSKHMDYNTFYESTKDMYFPSWIERCEVCKCPTVFDLLGLSDED